MHDREKILFEHEIQSKISGLNFQRERIFNRDNKELWNRKVSPIHDVDFYLIILNRLRRELISKKTDPRVENILNENKSLIDRIEVRHDFEHPTKDKMVPTDLSTLPPGTISGPDGTSAVVFTSLLKNVIVSGDFRWDLKKDHDDFLIILQEFTKLYPFNWYMSKFQGVIIKESLEDESILDKIDIISTEVKQVTEKYKTPWVKQWTLHTVEVEADYADMVAQEISKALDHVHNWYVDFKNKETHYIIFRDKVFKIDRTNVNQYDEATKYGISIGIPEYQVDFAPNVVNWAQ